jgi:hypothetical protein
MVQHDLPRTDMTLDLDSKKTKAAIQTPADAPEVDYKKLFEEEQARRKAAEAAVVAPAPESTEPVYIELVGKMKRYSRNGKLYTNEYKYLVLHDAAKIMLEERLEGKPIFRRWKPVAQVPGNPLPIQKQHFDARGDKIKPLSVNPDADVESRGMIPTNAAVEAYEADDEVGALFADADRSDGVDV